MDKTDKFPLDYKKLKADDRRWLLGFWTNHCRWNGNIIMALTSMYLSIISFFVACFSVLIAVEKGFTGLVMIFGIIFLGLLIVSFFIFRKYKLFFLSQGKTGDKKYKELFRIHFKYAKKL